MSIPENPVYRSMPIPTTPSSINEGSANKGNEADLKTFVPAKGKMTLPLIDLVSLPILNSDALYLAGTPHPNTPVVNPDSPSKTKKASLQAPSRDSSQVHRSASAPTKTFARIKTDKDQLSFHPSVLGHSYSTQLLEGEPPSPAFPQDAVDQGEIEALAKEMAIIQPQRNPHRPPPIVIFAGAPEPLVPRPPSSHSTSSLDCSPDSALASAASSEKPSTCSSSETSASINKITGDLTS